MKKKNLKSLTLNKMIISNLEQTRIKGGTLNVICQTEVSEPLCPSYYCISTVMNGPVQNTCGCNE